MHSRRVELPDLIRAAFIIGSLKISRYIVISWCTN